jgi:hypothetical protein
MKSSTLVSLSLLLNIGLIGAIVALVRNRPPSAPTGAETRFITNTTVKVVQREAPAALPIRSNIWKSVESPDYAAYVANLRGLGCPEETIRDIVISDLRKLYAEKTRALNPALKPDKFWEPPLAYHDPAMLEFRSQTSAIEKEKSALIRSLLGISLEDYMARTGSAQWGNASLSFLPEERRSKLAALQTKYAELQQEVYRNMKPGQNYQELFANLQQQHNDEIRASLSAGEYEEYQMRNSYTGQMLRQGMAMFHGTEDEFKTIYGLQKAFDDRFNPQGGAAWTNSKERQDAQKELDAALQNALGPQRYADYKRANDYEFRAIYTTAQQNKLPEQAALAVYDLKNTAQDQRRQIQANAALPPDQRMAALKALQEDTERRVQQALGDTAFTNYKTTGGWWLQQLGR